MDEGKWEDPTTWRRRVFLSKLSCLSPRPPSKTTPPNPTPLQSKRKKHLHQLPRHRNPPYIHPHFLRSRPYPESSSPAVTSGSNPLTSFCAPGAAAAAAAARAIRHETRNTSGGGGCLQSSTSGSRLGMSAYCRTSSSQSRETIAARIVEQRIQVGPCISRERPTRATCYCSSGSD